MKPLLKSFGCYPNDFKTVPVSAKPNMQTFDLRTCFGFSEQRPASNTAILFRDSTNPQCQSQQAIHPNTRYDPARKWGTKIKLIIERWDNPPPTPCIASFYLRRCLLLCLDCVSLVLKAERSKTIRGQKGVMSRRGGGGDNLYNNKI